MRSLTALASDPMAFIQELIIPTRFGPRRCGDVMQVFQRDRLTDLAADLLALGNGTQPPAGRHWWETSKGTSKTSDVAAAVLWLCVFSQRPLFMQAGAVDRDNAAELVKSAKAILHENAWLQAAVDVQNWAIVGKQTGAVCEIVAADQKGSHGAKPALVFLDECGHVPDERWEFVANQLDNAAKVAGVTICATNAGWTNTEAFKLRELVRQSPRWKFHQWAEPSPLMDPAEVEEAKRRNTASRYRRLYWGVWGPRDEGDGIPPAKLDAGIVAEPAPWNLPPHVVCVVGAIDAGLKADAFGIAICGVDVAGRRPRVRTLYTRSWHPLPGIEIRLAEVESTIRDVAGRYACREWLCDPWQAAYLRQRLVQFGLNARDVAPTPANLDVLAQTVWHSFQEGLFIIPNDMTELIDDLRRMSIVEKPGQQNTAFRLVAPRHSGGGHADVGFAWCMAATQCQIYSRTIGQRREVAELPFGAIYPSVGQAALAIPYHSPGVPLPEAYHPHDSLARQGYRPETARPIDLHRRF